MKKQKVNPQLLDEENPEWTESDFARAVPLEALPEPLKLKIRGPQKSPTKEQINIRLSRSVLESFRATGDGWQTRIDEALKDWLKEHKPA